MSYSLSEFRADQGAGRDQAVYIRDELSAPNFARHLAVMEKRGRFSFEKWRGEFDPIVAQLDLAMMRRDQSGTDQRVEAGQIDEDVAKGNAWIRVVVALLDQEAFRGNVAARELLPHAYDANEQADTFRHGRPLLATLYDRLMRHPGTPTMGFEPGFLEQAPNIIAGLEKNMSELTNAQIGIASYAEMVRGLMRQVEFKVTEVDKARELTMALTGEDIPGFDMRLIKAAAASTRTPDEPAPATVDAPNTPAATPTGATGL